MNSRGRPVASRPNIVLIHWHDLGTHLGCYGHDDVLSPCVDRLAGEGVRFEHAFATAPLCTPARGSLFTGRYPHSNGLMGLSHRGWEYAPGEVTLPMMLRHLGYRSTLIGLQHESQDPGGRLGYDEIISAADPADGREHCGPVSQSAVDWLSRDGRGADPFLLVVGFFEVHRPFGVGRNPRFGPGDVTVPDYLPDESAVREDLAEFYGAIHAADTATGRILAAIDANGLRDDTLVIFTTDHGEAFPGAKSTLYDPGLRVALIVRPPGSGRVRGGGEVHDGLVSHLDVAPTLVDFAGGNVSDRVQGSSFAGVLRGEPSAPREEIFAEKTYHSEYDPMRAVRTREFKYIRSYEPRPRLQLPTDLESSRSRDAIGDAHLAPRAAEELYDLAADPHERTNLAADPSYATTLNQLRDRLTAWQQATDDPILTAPITEPSHSP